MTSRGSRTAATRPRPPSLFSWPQHREMAAIEEARQRLVRRAAALPPTSHRRIVLEARIAALTERLLSTELALGEEGR